jgi:hypothetical protein
METPAKNKREKKKKLEKHVKNEAYKQGQLKQNKQTNETKQKKKTKRKEKLQCKPKPIRIALGSGLSCAFSANTVRERNCANIHTHNSREMQ